MEMPWPPGEETLPKVVCRSRSRYGCDGPHVYAGLQEPEILPNVFPLMRTFPPFLEGVYVDD
jgi:hypothetical protein